MVEDGIGFCGKEEEEEEEEEGKNSPVSAAASWKVMKRARGRICLDGGSGGLGRKRGSTYLYEGMFESGCVAKRSERDGGRKRRKG